jgi:hypothetical protein
MNKISQQIARAAAIAGAMLFSSQAFALTTTGNGSACLPDDQNDVYLRNSSGYTFTSGSDVHCPMVIDSSTTTISDADVFVALPTATTATCFLIVRSQTGSILSSETASVTAPGTDVDFTAGFAVSAGSNNSVSLRCTMPASGRIVGYSFDH